MLSLSVHVNKMLVRCFYREHGLRWEADSTLKPLKPYFRKEKAMGRENLKVVSKTGIEPEVLPAQENVQYGLARIDRVKPNPYQPRAIFDEAELSKLADTIRANGCVDEDVVLAKYIDGEFDNSFTIINGDRRIRASKMAGLTHVPAKILVRVSRKELLERACRSDFCKVPLNIVEKAFAIRSMMTVNGWNQAEVARCIGKHPVTVSNALKIFNLTEDLQAMALSGKIPPDVALQLSRWEESAQTILLSACTKEIAERGRPFSQQELLLFVRKEAERLGLERKKGKKVRKNLSHSILLARSVTRTVEKLKKDLKELSEIKPIELSSMKDPPLLDLIGTLEEVSQTVLEKIAVFNAITD